MSLTGSKGSREDDNYEHDEQSAIEEHTGLAAPANHGISPPFHDLITNFINPLSKVTMAGGSRFSNVRIKIRRGEIIRSFIKSWRSTVGPNVYPFFRLLLPNIDRERLSYGLKETALARLLIKAIGISPNADDAKALLNFRLPGAGLKSTGDFAERCYEIIQKRESLSDFGQLSIDEVNIKLDELSQHPDSEQQLAILTYFSKRMNAEEMKWLVRIILRQLHIGLSEKSLFGFYHPDANALFNVSSSLKRVCWELCDPSVFLNQEENQISLMSCFRPQLAEYPRYSSEQISKKMNGHFFIEEKLDGERMQMHYSNYGKRLAFFSRKATEYTYLYGCATGAANGSLSRYIQGAIDSNVESCILDGEMISWDSLEERIEPFGYLKTAARADQEGGISTSYPLYRVFDVVYLNGKSIVSARLEDRRSILEEIIHPVSTHFELHPFELSTMSERIDIRLRQVIAESSEGLVIKNPDSPYVVNQRLDSWIKVKPEYMEEFGESLDVLVIGGYYGQGKRRNQISSFLCGLRTSELAFDGTPKFWSFCRVGGGFTSSEYATIRHLTDGHWQRFDRTRPLNAYFDLAGLKHDKEAPDMCINPKYSVVLEIKAASVVPASEQYRAGVTLRFPRFRRIRMDRDFMSSLSVDELTTLAEKVARESQERLFERESRRQDRRRARTKIDILDDHTPIKRRKVSESKLETKLFQGHSFILLLDRRRRIPLELEIISNGGTIVYKDAPSTSVFHYIAESNLVKVVSLKRRPDIYLVKPDWIHDCLFNRHIVPFEPRHLFYASDSIKNRAKRWVDRYGDSYVCEMQNCQELQHILQKMSTTSKINRSKIFDTLHDLELCTPSTSTMAKSFLFSGLTMYFQSPKSCYFSSLSFRIVQAKNYAKFANALIADSLDDPQISHIVVDTEVISQRNLKALCTEIASGISTKSRIKTPRIVRLDWIFKCWNASWKLIEDGELFPFSTQSSVMS
ncbi:ATP dependent DNA ligase domain-containing protein [Lipomyces oligophaga]|uniref:ATP dependent DNA ligase domain-containing protein n=1 Tax=Lipomyces oligophaga TaxID=45792 RepID=UPI0034CD380A